MKTAVRYYTRSGNTRKVAQAIGNALSLTAEDVSKALDTKYDVVFLGSSYYGFDADSHVKDFITKNRDKIGCIAVFGTSALLGSTRGRLKKTCSEAGVKLLDTEFHCAGSFGPMHKGRPDENDLKNAAEFAVKTMKYLGKKAN